MTESRLGHIDFIRITKAPSGRIIVITILFVIYHVYRGGQLPNRIHLLYFYVIIPKASTFISTFLLRNERDISYSGALFFGLAAVSVLPNFEKPFSTDCDSSATAQHSTNFSSGGGKCNGNICETRSLQDEGEIDYRNEVRIR